MSLSKPSEHVSSRFLEIAEIHPGLLPGLLKLIHAVCDLFKVRFPHKLVFASKKHATNMAWFLCIDKTQK